MNTKSKAVDTKTLYEDIKNIKYFKKFNNTQSNKEELEAICYLQNHNSNQYLYNIIDQIADIDISYINIKYLLKDRLPYLNKKSHERIRQQLLLLEFLTPSELHSYYKDCLLKINQISTLNINNTI